MNREALLSTFTPPSQAEREALTELAQLSAKWRQRANQAVIDRIRARGPAILTTVLDGPVYEVVGGVFRRMSGSRTD